MSTLVGHIVSSPGEWEKWDRRDSRGDEREGQGRKRKMNENEEAEEITVTKPVSVGHPGDVRYTTPLPHPTIPDD